MKLKIGNHYSLKLDNYNPDIHILAQVATRKIQLISLSNGNRWSDNTVTLDEGIDIGKKFKLNPHQLDQLTNSTKIRKA